MDFGDTAAALEDQRRQQGKNCTVTLIDSSEIGNDEGDDIFVLVYNVHSPGMPDIHVDPHDTVRWAIYVRGDDTAKASGIVR
jgi:hypothetical protein